MKKNHVNILKLTIPVFLACVCFLIALSKNNQATMPVSLSLEIEGQYSYDNENWYPILKDTCFSDSEKELWLKLDFDVNWFIWMRKQRLCKCAISFFRLCVAGHGIAGLWMGRPTQKRL